MKCCLVTNLVLESVETSSMEYDSAKYVVQQTAIYE